MPELGDQESVLDFLISQIFLKSEDYRASKSTVYKILFELKNNLNEDNPIKEMLPFYWYFYGPNSDVIKDKIIKMQSNCILEKQFLKNGWPIYLLKKQVKSQKYEGLEEALSLLMKILDTFDFSKTVEYREHIYRKFAPFTFMITFKYDFMQQLRSFNRKITSKIIFRENDFDDEIEREFRKLQSLLYLGEIESSENPLFETFQECYSSFATSADRIMESNLDEKNFKDFNLKKQILDLLTGETWKTFAFGVRIPEEGHDPFYNDRVPEWEMEYASSLEEYDNSIEDFYSGSINYISLCRLRSRILNDDNKSILSSAIGGYLGFEK